jgi:MOSC domain-containing protein YiiM
MADVHVVSVHRSPTHEFSKQPVDDGVLLAGLGLEGDAHAGSTVRHRSRVAADPHQPNLRQVHLIHQELLDELRGRGFDVGPGDLGENLTTSGIDLLGLPVGSVLLVPSGALLAVTGLRNPCGQIDRFRTGLRGAVLDEDEEGRRIRRAGVMAVVLRSGAVRPGDELQVALPPQPHQSLEPI